MRRGGAVCVLRGRRTRGMLLREAAARSVSVRWRRSRIPRRRTQPRSARVLARRACRPPLL